MKNKKGHVAAAKKTPSVAQAPPTPAKRGLEALPGKKIFWGLSALLLVIMLAIAPFTGATTDESLIDGTHGKYALKYYLDGDTTFVNYPRAGIQLPLSNIDIFDFQRYFGVGFEIIPAIALQCGLLPQKYEYEFRHLLCAFFGWLLMLFTGLMGREIKNWQVGILSLLTIAATPVIFGLSFIASKDIPLAAGFAIGVYAFLRIYKTYPVLRWQDAALALVGIAMAVSVRIGGLLLPFYAGAGWLLYKLIFRKKKANVYKELKCTLLIALLCIVGTLAGMCFYPNFFYEGLFNHIVHSLTFVQHHPVGIPFVWNGVYHDSLNLPPYFMGKSYGLTIPPFVFVGAILMLLSINKLRKNYPGFQWCFLVFTVLFPILYLWLSHSPIYQGWRHTTFVYSSFVPLVAIGFYETYLGFGKKFKGTMQQWLFPIFLAVLMLPTVAWMVRNYKYTYAYWNVFAGKQQGYFDLDYLHTAAPVALDWLLQNKLTDTTRRYTIAVKSRNAGAYAYTKNYPNISFVYSDEMTYAETPCDYYITNTMYITHDIMRRMFPPKGTVHVEKVDNNPICAVVAKHPAEAEGIALVKAGNNAEGMAKLEQAYAYAPNNYGLWYWMGVGYFNLRQLDKSIEFFTRDVNFIAPPVEQVNARMMMGEAYMQKGQYNDALQILQTAHNINAQQVGDANAQILIGADMGLCLYYTQNYAGAVPYLEAAINDYPHLMSILQECKYRQ
ncbi:hypothetical protein AGMMS4956_08850 [Bacteroidia bacterium]|nr:hypothetical protein AGMMS4956_08850 [Bacteroidia bacterium]